MSDSVPQQSRREQIIAAMVARAQAIRRYSGFNTDAGATLIVGERIKLSAGDPDSALQLIVGDSLRATWMAGKVMYRLPFQFTALASAGREESWRDAERLLQDVKRAIELEDTRLGGLLDHPGLERSPEAVLEREPGATDVGIEITYFAPLQETWGHP